MRPLISYVLGLLVLWSFALAACSGINSTKTKLGLSKASADDSSGDPNETSSILASPDPILNDRSSPVNPGAGTDSGKVCMVQAPSFQPSDFLGSGSWIYSYPGQAGSDQSTITISAPDSQGSGKFSANYFDWALPFQKYSLVAKLYDPKRSDGSCGEFDGWDIWQINLIGSNGLTNPALLCINGASTPKPEIRLNIGNDSAPAVCSGYVYQAGSARN